MKKMPLRNRRRSIPNHGPILLAVLFGTLTTSPGQDGVSHTVPFTAAQGHLVLVRGSMGQERDLTFLIDTGASCTYVNENLARRLSLRGEKKTAVAYGKSVESQQVILREFFVGTARFHTVPARIIRIGDRLPQVGGRIDVILGLNALTRAELAIDYERKRVTFGPSPAFGNSAPLETTREAIVAQVEVEGRILRMMFDTGSPLVLLYKRRLDGGAPGRRVPVEKKLYHVAARETLNGVLLSAVRLGEDRWDRLSAFLLDSPVTGYEGLHGVLGPRNLGLDRVHFDFRRNRVSWERRTPAPDRRAESIGAAS